MVGLRAAASATLFLAIGAACTGAAPSTRTPSAAPTQTQVAAPTLPPTPAPTVAPATATPGPTQIPWDPNAAIPSGTLTLKLTAKNYQFSTDSLTAPANTPFVIAFSAQDTEPHNVAIKLNGVLLFNPLPGIVDGGANYFIPSGLAPGSYLFLCTIHPTMSGDLTITP